MSDSELVQLLGDEGRRHPTSPDERRSKLIAISARVGVWGIIGGLCSIILGPMLPAAGLGAAALGFMAAGAGSIGTAILVVKDLKKASWPLKLAAFVGIPFGASLILAAGGLLLGWPLFPMGLAALALPAGVILGVILMILLITGFLSHAFLPPNSEWGD